MTGAGEADLPPPPRGTGTREHDLGLDWKLRVIPPDPSVQGGVRRRLDAGARSLDAGFQDLEARRRHAPVLFPSRLFDRMRPGESEEAGRIDDLGGSKNETY